MDRAGKIQQAVEAHQFRVIRLIIQKIPNTVEVLLTPFDDDVVDLPIVFQDRPNVIQTVQKSLEIPHIQFLDKVGFEPSVCTGGPQGQDSAKGR